MAAYTWPSRSSCIAKGAFLCLTECKLRRRQTSSWKLLIHIFNWARLNSQQLNALKSGFRWLSPYDYSEPFIDCAFVFLLYIYIYIHIFLRWNVCLGISQPSIIRPTTYFINTLILYCVFWKEFENKLLSSIACV